MNGWESRYLTTPSAGWVTDPLSSQTGYTFASQNARPVAVFTPAAVVPVPAALPLFLSGFALVGWIGRRRRRGC